MYVVSARKKKKKKRNAPPLSKLRNILAQGSLEQSRGCCTEKCLGRTERRGEGEETRWGKALSFLQLCLGRGGGEADDAEQPGEEAHDQLPKLLRQLGAAQQNPEEAEQQQGLEGDVHRVLPFHPFS